VEFGHRVREMDQSGFGLRVFSGIECDIRRDGTMDLEDDALGELVFVIEYAPGGEVRAGDWGEVTASLASPRQPRRSGASGPLEGHRGRCPWAARRGVVGARVHGAGEVERATEASGPVRQHDARVQANDGIAKS
jgi:hypothetical protein